MLLLSQLHWARKNSREAWIEARGPRPKLGPGFAEPKAYLLRAHNRARAHELGPGPVPALSSGFGMGLADIILKPVGLLIEHALTRLGSNSFSDFGPL